jgi:hypothetical protein
MFLTSLIDDLKSAAARGAADLHAVVSERLPEVEQIASTLEADPLVHEALDAVENATLSPPVRSVIAHMLADLKGAVTGADSAAAPAEASAAPADPAAVPDTPPTVQAGVPAADPAAVPEPAGAPDGTPLI